jgi:hypothetical protein
MESSGRESAFFLGALVVLSGGAAALSLSTAPPVAVQQLHIGAGATVGVGSLVIHANEVKATAGAGSAPRSSALSIVDVYQGPDRWAETARNGQGQIGQLVVIGNQSWQRTLPGRWVELPSSDTIPSKGEAASQQNFALAALAQNAESVTRHGVTSSAVYSFELSPAALIETFGGTPPPGFSYSLSALIDGPYMTGQQLSASNGSASERIMLKYSQLGTAPPVTAPTPGTR